MKITNERLCHHTMQFLNIEDKNGIQFKVSETLGIVTQSMHYHLEKTVATIYADESDEYDMMRVEIKTILYKSEPQEAQSNESN